jgi:hypothetical protein
MLPADAPSVGRQHAAPSLPAGNMWLARCDYICTLPPPANFSRLLDSVELTAGCKPWMLGVGRAAQEHWATSHPSAVVYDVLPYNSTNGTRLTYRWCLYKLVHVLVQLLQRHPPRLPLVPI